MDDLFIEVTVDDLIPDEEAYAGTYRVPDTLVRLEGSAEALAAIRDAITAALAAEA